MKKDQNLINCHQNIHNWPNKKHVKKIWISHKRNSKFKNQKAKLSIRQTQDPEYIEGQVKIKNKKTFYFCVVL